MHHYSYCRFIWTRIGERSERSLSDVDGVSSFCGISGGVRISISSFIILLWYMKAHSSASNFTRKGCDYFVKQFLLGAAVKYFLLLLLSLSLKIYDISALWCAKQSTKRGVRLIQWKALLWPRGVLKQLSKFASLKLTNSLISCTAQVRKSLKNAPSNFPST